MRRICCFCENWESGGIESFLSNVLFHMDFTELHIDIVAARVKESVFTQGLQKKGIRLIELSGKLRSPKNFRVFRDLLKENRYDVVHFNLFQGVSLYYAQIAKEEGVTVRIAHSHNTGLRKSRTKALKLLLHKVGSRLFTNAATDFWACSQQAAEFLFTARALSKRGYQFIPNGIDIVKFRFDSVVRESIRQELGIEDCFAIGNVGRLCYQKNQLFLLDVLAKTLKRRPNCCLLLIGDGEDRKLLERKAQILNIANRVIFYGVTDQIEKLFCAMDAFALPSRFEGLGIVAIEAQAAGLPVICSNSVPKEAYVTEQMTALPLETDLWADSWCSMSASERREKRGIEQSEFDIQAVASRIKEKYLSEGSQMK